jgi:hypothetical protein
MLVENSESGSLTLELPSLVTATENWLRRLHESYRDWREIQGTQVAGGDKWQEVVRWYTAFELNFAQLAQIVDDQTDVEDARLSLEEGGKSIRVDRIRMLPLARQRLRVLAPELRKHLLDVHLQRLFAQVSAPDEERIAGMDALYRIRAHGCRVIYHRSDQGPLVLAVTQVAWPHPLRDITPIPSMPIST